MTSPAMLPAVVDYAAAPQPQQDWSNGRALKWVGWALLALASLSGAFLIASCTRLGAGIQGDSVAYLSAARNLAAGRGLVWFNSDGGFEPLYHFPPGYPALLSAAAFAGRDVRPWARGVDVFCFGGVVLLTGLMAARAVRRPEGETPPFGMVFAGLAAMLVATTLPLLAVFSRMMSEPPYLLLVTGGMLLLTVATERARGRRTNALLLVAAGACWGVAVLVRYAGFYLLPTGALILGSAMVGTDGTWRRTVRDAIIFLAAACLPVVGWMVRNQIVAGTATSRHYSFTPPPAEAYDLAVVTLRSWLFRSDAAGLYRPTVGLLAAFVLVPPAVWILNRRIRRSTSNPAMLTLWLYAALYLPFIWAARAFADGAIAFHYRTLGVIYPVVTALAVAWLFNGLAALLRRREGNRVAVPRDWLLVAWSIAAVGLGLLCFQNVGPAWGWSREAREYGLDYSASRWVESPTLAAVETLPADTRIWTDGPDVIYARTGRVSSYPPRGYYRDSQKVNRQKWDHLREMGTEAAAADKRVKPGEPGAVLVLFKRLNRPWLVSFEDMDASFTLTPLDLTSDGAIYRITPKPRRR